MDLYCTKVIRRIFQGEVIYIPFDSWPREVINNDEALTMTKLDNDEVPIPRSGADSVGRGPVTGLTSPRSSVKPTSLLALLRFLRCFFGTGRKSLHFISLRRWCRLAKLGTDGGMITDSGPRG